MGRDAQREERAQPNRHRGQVSRAATGSEQNANVSCFNSLQFAVEVVAPPTSAATTPSITQDTVISQESVSNWYPPLTPCFSVHASLLGYSESNVSACLQLARHNSSDRRDLSLELAVDSRIIYGASTIAPVHIVACFTCVLGRTARGRV